MKFQRKLNGKTVMKRKAKSMMGVLGKEKYSSQRFGLVDIEKNKMWKNSSY